RGGSAGTLRSAAGRARMESVRRFSDHHAGPIPLSQDPLPPLARPFSRPTHPTGIPVVPAPVATRSTRRTPYSGIAVYSDRDDSARPPAPDASRAVDDRQAAGAPDEDEFFWGDGWAEIAGMSFGRRDSDDDVMGPS